MKEYPKKVAVFTGTRAEYGLLFWLLKDMKADTEFELQLIVSGAHLSPEFGLTYKQIENDGFDIDEKIECLLSSNTAIGVAKSFGLSVIGICDALSRLKPDFMVVLGDRYETLAAAQASMFLHIPILHIHGGEVTEGAYDDVIRHSLSKLSTLHCTSTESHRHRVIQLGEHPNRVCNVGALGLDNLRRLELLSRDELSTSINFKLNRPYFIVTYHPVTYGEEDPKETMVALLESLDLFPDHQILLTYPNADEGGRAVIPLLEDYAASQPDRVACFKSLGQLRYLSAVKYSSAVIGNSSSGIIEVPSFSRPTVNIGIRQKGRESATSVIHANVNKHAIVSAINQALECYSDLELNPALNPYDKGDASSEVIKLLKSFNSKDLKSFYDISFDPQ
ncbi:UDP-N-acetylglucosamine 2-epimerase [Marinomonas mediterranea]|jgi:UDP-N-acetyl-D-glucosamine 2-epimerase, UDP-hydrolysing|uniref:UDP-N-acetyl-D-glucosamine 2-epimerase, UDP-hydrolysing n=1 Tax=Marinomonas mediterranea (strain ATCC 700492 / JCM 21426 / NBRC 103028 / MMB-1) TaxID=717774 RepID=F2K4C2_MARM1|nr:UDP-N-acetylglucosamine 2-epimerase [Marinomonas mediterranea]ADZ92563.1 UDP-N-acetyl-D-glucosamine 2-epimerase, UDP-hydrolysing [Marinomonas mediterranea MMB-1]WCN10507.1 UDP-N-acetylglucosamine 2-epimerase (hydrolyzing) [Marinomonas mediterranea]WCN14557.1 UDP-N-acetylglucosamine 2-epimerase (hydrolyzing) [Marinomonas mediterranea]WCN18606.1 UDP-N-acetylglucosamine 2-epimerase (hydrolyzing) [Marinomonas mediterranea MMB-1]